VNRLEKVQEGFPGVAPKAEEHQAMDVRERSLCLRLGSHPPAKGLSAREERQGSHKAISLQHGRPNRRMGDGWLSEGLESRGACA
jgi:hypothetical protein